MVYQLGGETRIKAVGYRAVWAPLYVATCARFPFQLSTTEIRCANGGPYGQELNIQGKSFDPKRSINGR